MGEDKSWKRVRTVLVRIGRRVDVDEKEMSPVANFKFYGVARALNYKKLASSSKSGPSLPNVDRLAALRRVAPPSNQPSNRDL